MRLFYVTEPIDATLRYDPAVKRVLGVAAPAGAAAPPPDGAAEPGARRFRLLPPDEGAGPADALHFGTAFEWAPLGRAMVAAGKSASFRLLSEAAGERVSRQLGLPPRLGYTHSLGLPFVPLDEQLDALAPPRGPLRVAVVNVFHLAFGDTVSCLTVLRELHRRLAERFGRVEIDLFQGHYLAQAERLYQRSGAVHAIVPLPAPLSRLLEYDAYLDFSLAPMNTQLPWGDVFLEAIGIDPRPVPAQAKRNRLPLDPEVARELAPAVEAVRQRGRPLLLFHPLASTPIRSLPPGRADALLHELLERTGATVASLVPCRSTHPRFVDWSGLSRTFDHMTYLVSRADMFVSVDTSLYHVADAFSVPGVVVFTSIAPELRVACYPYVEGIALRREGNRLDGMHGSEDEEDVAYAHALWERLDVDEVLAALDAAVRRRAGDAPPAPDAGSAAAEEEMLLSA